MLHFYNLSGKKTIELCFDHIMSDKPNVLKKEKQKTPMQHNKDDDFTLVIAAAGTGQRFSGNETNDKPKQFKEILGKTLLRHTLDAFENHPSLNEVYIAINPDYGCNYHDACAGYQKPVYFINGGKTRQKSVFNVLEELRRNNLASERKVLIHDAARPMIARKDIDAVLDALNQHAGVTLCHPVTNTLRRGNGDHVARDNLYAVQTPQGFRFKTILDAYEKFATSDTYTDDAGLVIKSGQRVELIVATHHNMKITYKKDLLLANTLLSTKLSTEIRVGQGFDVHAFDNNDTVSVDKVRLCGVDIPHNRKLLGHSDADVGLHALTDAIYGAIGAGDIGLHFPPSNNDFKDMDSALFLEHAMKMLKEKGGTLGNADITLICEKPKISAYRLAITERLADILNIEQSRINIKATTTEKLGFAGREEGIAAQAIVSITLPVREGNAND